MAKQMSQVRQLIHTHPRSGSPKLPWDQITHTFADPVTATPVAQSHMRFKARRAEDTEGVSLPTWFPKD